MFAQKFPVLLLGCVGLAGWLVGFCFRVIDTIALQLEHSTSNKHRETYRSRSSSKRNAMAALDDFPLLSERMICSHHRHIHSPSSCVPPPRTCAVAWSWVGGWCAFKGHSTDARNGRWCGVKTKKNTAASEKLLTKQVQI